MSDIDEAEGRRLAQTAGLTRLTDTQLAQFIAGARVTRTLTGRLPKDLHWTEEPAHTFGLERQRRSPQ